MLVLADSHCVSSPILRPSEETLIKSLPKSSPTVPLSWLALAIDRLAGAVSDTGDPASLSSPDRATLLDAAAGLLSACNAVSRRLERLLRARLPIRLALRLLSSAHPPTLAALRRARDLIAEWEDDSRTPSPAADPVPKYRSKNSAIGDAILLMEAVAGDDGYLSGAAEVEAAAAAVSDLATAIDVDETAERLRIAVEAAEKATGELTEVLERLSDAVTRLFRTAMSTRNSALGSFRMGPQKCK